MSRSTPITAITTLILATACMGYDTRGRGGGSVADDDAIGVDPSPSVDGGTVGECTLGDPCAMDLPDPGEPAGYGGGQTGSAGSPLDPGFGGSYGAAGSPIDPGFGGSYGAAGSPIDPGFGGSYGAAGSPIDPGFGGSYGAAGSPIDPGWGGGAGAMPSDPCPWVRDCYLRVDECFATGAPGCEAMLPTCEELATTCTPVEPPQPVDCNQNVNLCLAQYDDCLAVGGGDCIRIIEVCGMIAAGCR